MYQIRRNQERGQADHGWLQSHHTFSFADYFDPAHMGFSVLRAINEDRVQPGQGFQTHDHRDMEILSYVIDGALEHKDSMGTGSVIRPGDVQRMTAGTGVSHSEFNHSQTTPVHFFQIWIIPEREGLKPGYEQKTFNKDASRGGLLLVASRDGHDDSVIVHQDISLYVMQLEAGESLSYSVRDDRACWIHVIEGSMKLADVALGAGDAAGIVRSQTLLLSTEGTCEALVFDLPGKF